MTHVLTRRTKFLLDEDRIPRAWYNIAADLRTPPPPALHPGTGQPVEHSEKGPVQAVAILVLHVDRSHRRGALELPAGVASTV